ncbi:MAG: hypothetical protein M3Q48_10465 [Actinomycetota bacterium]|nr:hypothetical protein [Actinomycetota bacterium]
MIDRAPRRSAASLVATWLGAAVGLGLLLALARSAEGPLDDPDQAWQRPGFLDAGDLPTPAPTVAPGVPPPGRASVVFFMRANGLPELCHALAASSLRDEAAITVVVAGSPPDGCDVAGSVVGDPAGAVAEAYGMRRPRGGGPPVGYAVVDAAGAIRYRTLDPDVSDQLGEVSTIVAALP